MSALQQLLLVLNGLSAVAWFVYFNQKDPRRSRRSIHRMVAIAGGAGSAVTALISFELLARFGWDIQWSTLVEGAWPEAIRSALAIGAFEELAKMFAVALLAAVTGRVKNPFEGLLCAACAGIGFAGAENAVLFLSGTLTPLQMLARVAAAPLTHALFAVPWGLGLAGLAREGRWAGALGGFALSLGSHAVYDLFVARGMKLASAALVLAGWLWLIRETPRLLQALRLGGVLSPLPPSPVLTQRPLM